MEVANEDEYEDENENEDKDEDGKKEEESEDNHKVLFSWFPYGKSTHGYFV